MKIISFIVLFLFFLTTKVISEITYLEILKDPTDLRLNLQYAKEQEAKREFKSVIATLERLNALYPNNIDLKLYLLSISIKTDSTEKTLNLISKIQSSDQISDEIKKKVTQVFDDMNKKKIDKEIVEKKKEREKAQLAAVKKEPEAKSPWTWYTEVSYTNMLNSNISNISDSKTQYSRNSNKIGTHHQSVVEFCYTNLIYLDKMLKTFELKKKRNYLFFNEYIERKKNKFVKKILNNLKLNFEDICIKPTYMAKPSFGNSRNNKVLQSFSKDFKYYDWWNYLSEKEIFYTPCFFTSLT